MKISKPGINFVREAEGWRKKAYKDTAGKWTIGCGHLITAEELKSGVILIGYERVKYADGLTDDQVNQLLDQDLDIAEKTVNSLVKVPLEQHQFDCLVSFAFNVGMGQFSESTLLKRLNAWDYKEIPSELRRWVYVKKAWDKGLANRREKEAELWGAPYPSRENKLVKNPVFSTTDKAASYKIEASGGYIKIEMIGEWESV